MMDGIHFFLAQADAVVSGNPALYAYGPLGVMVAWFMLRGETFIKEVRKTREDTINELQNYGHKIDGLRIAMLVNTAENDQVSQKLRDFCRLEISRIQAKNDER